MAFDDQNWLDKNWDFDVPIGDPIFAAGLSVNENLSQQASNAGRFLDTLAAEADTARIANAANESRMNELSAKLDAVTIRCNDLADKICQIERDAATVHAALEHMQMVDLKLEVAGERLSETETHLENLDPFLDELRDIVMKVVKAAAPHLDLKSPVLPNFVCGSSENMDRGS